MTFLTRIHLNPLRPGAQKLLSSPQAMHSAVAGATALYDDPGRNLWRLDSDNVHRPTLWLVTQQQPEVTHIVEQAGWPGAEAGQPQTHDYAPLLGRISTGARFAFRLTANPVQTITPVKREDGGRKRDGRDPMPYTRGTVRGHRTAQHQTQWLLDNSARWGFEIPAEGAEGEPDMRITARQRLSFTKGPRRDTPRVVITSATYAGHLTITDPDRFTTALTQGIGRARAYGCGLITLAHAG